MDDKVSVVTALKPGEKVKKTFRGETEWLKVSSHSVSANRNTGWKRAKSPYILFIDSDIDVGGIDVGTLPEYGFDLACAYLNTDFALDYFTVVNQNILATLRSPFACNGSFMFVHKQVLEEIGGFKDMYLEDVEFASRAYVFGYKLGSFPFTVKHTRPFTPPLQWIGNNIMRQAKSFIPRGTSSLKQTR